MGAMLARFLMTAAAIPLCARFMDGVTVLDLTNTLIVGAVLGLAYTLIRPLVRLILSVINFCTLGIVSIFVDAWFIQLVGGGGGRGHQRSPHAGGRRARGAQAINTKETKHAFFSGE